MNNLLERINQCKTINSHLLRIDQEIEVSKSVCKIITSSFLGTGFFIKINIKNESFYYLMTNDHVVKRDLIEKKDEIEIKYDNQSQTLIINLDNEKRIIQDFLYLNIDLIIIQILPQDKIDDKYFLLPNLEYLNGYNQFVDKEIYILQYAEGGNLQFSLDKIKSVNSYTNELTHLSSTSKGSSGSPIILKGSKFVLGIHKRRNKKEEENYGNFIGPVIDALKSKVKIEKLKKFNWSYEGEMVNDKKEGKGKLVFKNGEFYIGKFKDNKFNGKGVYYYKKNKIKYMGNFVQNHYEGEGTLYKRNGEYYIGHFKKGKKNGKGCEYSKNKTLKYEGDFIEDIYNGNGKYIYENGNYYIGSWTDGKRHGKGILYKKSNDPIFKGDFVKDKYEGNGILYYDNGDYYKGEFKNGKRNGKGIEYYKSNNIKFEGIYYDDKIQDGGIFYYEDGSFYIGKFLNGEQNGIGIIAYNENIENYNQLVFNNEKNNEYITNMISDIKKYNNIGNEKEIIYYGEFKNGKKNGNGVMFYKHYKEIYEGPFLNDQPEGNGKYIDEKGNQFLGEFKKGKKNGNFIVINKCGEIIYEGDFVNDMMEGFGKYINEKKEIYLGEFIKGKKYGKGALYSENNKIIYEGNFFDDEPDYHGFYELKENTYYLGEEKDGLPNGKGNLYDKETNEEIYDGEFMNGKFEGFGILNDKYNKNSKGKYEGQFHKGLKHGKGVFYFYEDNNYLRYEGNFINDYFEGRGKLFYKNGGYLNEVFCKGKRIGSSNAFNENNEQFEQGYYNRSFSIFGKPAKLDFEETIIKQLTGLIIDKLFGKK